MEVEEVPVMTRISPATADRFALFIEALGAEAAELSHQAAAAQSVDRRAYEAAHDVNLSLEIRPRRL